MNLVERAKNIVLQPNQEWPVIAAEAADTKSLFVGYAMPLAAIPPIAAWLGFSVIGVSAGILGTYRAPIVGGLGVAIVSYVLGLISVFALGLIIDALAPSFGGQKNNIQAMKCAVYAHTPAWLGGIFHLVPALGVLALVAALYGLYLLYLGLPVLMKAPSDKTVGYAVVVVLCAIVLTIVISAIAGIVGFTGGGINAAGMLRGDADPFLGSTRPEVRVRIGVGDMAAAGGLFALTAMMGAGQSKESDAGWEKRHKVDGRLVIDKLDRRSGADEYGVVLANRFVIDTSSSNVDPQPLRAIIAKLDLGKLEAMK